MKKIILETPLGKIRGLETEEGIQRFAGVRYAFAGRWEYPRQAGAWEGIYEADEFGPACYQNRAFRPESDENFYYREFRKGESYRYSEDCFFLNIWKPAVCREAPVILYIHGGAFQGGCGNEKHFSGEAYARKGIIFITCNYRLGVLGFCSLPELAKRDGHTGNYGLYDQLTVLKWIHDNIRAFGGDPERITLMGQSAGAMSVQHHCLSPLSRGLLSSAVMTSGGGIPETFGNYYCMEETWEFWKKVMSSLGNSLGEWLAAPVQQLFEAAGKEAWQTENGIQYLMPVLDKMLIVCTPDEMRTQKQQARIPYLMGSTKDDMIENVLDEMAREWAVLQEKQGMVPSYCFRFDRNLPGDEKGAWHSSELWYTLGTLERCWRPMTDWDYKISDTLVSYISNFAKTGNPNGDGLPVWDAAKSGDGRILVVDDETMEMK